MQQELETMRTAYVGQDLSARSFAAFTLAAQKRSLELALTRGALLPRLVVASVMETEIAPQTDRDHPVDAYVNCGRWLARCECGGCEYVDMEQRVFMCASCWNRDFGHRFRRVIAPAAPGRRRVERALLRRPKAANRNWYPRTETAADLERENEAMGLLPEAA